jgi:hypothetical protein
MLAETFNVEPNWPAIMAVRLCDHSAFREQSLRHQTASA